MTHDLHFVANQTFLSFVKRTIEEPPSGKRLTREYCAVSLLSLCSGVEATVNSIFIDDGRLPHYDDLRLKSKIETLATWGDVEINWGGNPWQDLNRLITVRNWLTHFKEPNHGLVGTDLSYVNQRPKIDPTAELTIDAVKRYYQASLSCLLKIADGLNLPEYEYGFLKSEEYEVFVLY